MWKLPANHNLVVLVHSVACHHEDIWTAELHDDTGASIKAWIAPGFVQSEKQLNSDHQRYIRPGFVWCLQGVSLMLQHGTLPGEHTEENEQAHVNKRMLLVRQEHIIRVWNHDSQDDITAEDFNAWLQQKSTLHGATSMEAARTLRMLHKHADKVFPSSTTRDDASRRRLGRCDDDDDEQENEEEEEDHVGYIHATTIHESGLIPVRQAEDEGDIGGPRIMSLHAATVQPSHLAQTKQSQNPVLSFIAQTNSCDRESDRDEVVMQNALMRLQSARPNPVTDPRDAPYPCLRGDYHPRSFVDPTSQQSRVRRVSMTPNPQLLMKNTQTDLRPIQGKEHDVFENHSHHQQGSTTPGAFQTSTLARMTPNVESQCLEQFSAANRKETQTNGRMSSFAKTVATASHKYKSQRALPEVDLTSGKPGRQKNHTDLSQFSTNTEKPSTSLVQVTAPTTFAPLPNQDSFSISTIERPQSQFSPPVLPRKRSKQPNSAKDKVPRYSPSPPKPTTATLWSSIAALQDTTGLLDLSSSDEEDGCEGTAKQQSSMVEKEKVMPQPTTRDDQSESSNRSKIHATSDCGQEIGSSLFGNPGIDWIGLSDEDE